ncbi:MAG: phosphoribosyltransferase [Alphaproteobacteria bacterium]|nr:phosphoribosyltransferase [Alphaproteobacteria bacterium]
MKMKILLCLLCSAVIAGYEGGPMVSKKGAKPTRQLVKGSFGSRKKDVVFEIVNKAYIEQASALGARALREKVKGYLRQGHTVAINFVVRGGWAAAEDYRQEFQKEIAAGSVKWGLLQVSTMKGMDSSDIYADDAGMAHGDIMVLVDDLVDTGLTQYLCLNLLKEKGYCHKPIILQSLMEKRPDEKVMCWKGEKKTIRLGDISVHDRLDKMNGELYNDSALKQMIDGCDCSVVVPEGFGKNWIVLPYAGEMPGMWPDVHDCLDAKHKDKALIVTPAIVFCNSDYTPKSADFEFGFCQSNRADLYEKTADKKDWSPAIYATIFVCTNALGEIKWVSDFKHMKRKGLLKKHERSIVMVLSQSSLQDKKLVSALFKQFNIPVNSQSSHYMLKKHPHLYICYDEHDALEVRDSVTKVQN